MGFPLAQLIQFTMLISVFNFNAANFKQTSDYGFKVS